MLSLRIALRYLFSPKSHNAVNLISIISLAGVAVATVAIVCVLSVFNGFSDLAYSRLSQMDPQLLVARADSRPIAAADSLADAIARADGVELALPTLTGQALAVFDERQMPVSLKGVPSGYGRLTDIDRLIIDGAYVDPDSAAAVSALAGDQNRHWATLSIGVAANLVSSAGFYDWVGIYAPRRRARINPANPAGSFAADSVMVAAVFEVDQPEYDTDLVILPLDAVRALLDYDDEATAIELLLAPGADEDAVREALRLKLGDDFTVKNRMEQQQHTFRMISVEKWITFLLLVFILVIASFNIISTLSILILEKQENIATMAALGAPRSLVRRIFTLEGWLVSAGGGLLGVIIGVGLCLAQQRYGFIKLAGDASRLTIEAYPVKVEAVDVLVVLVMVALVGLLSTVATRRFLRSRV